MASERGKMFKLYRGCLKKSRYSTLRSANAAAAKMQFAHPTERKFFMAYRCEHCEFWHVGRTKSRKGVNFPDGWDRPAPRRG
jgi:hypothetical protein